MSLEAILVGRQALRLLIAQSHRNVYDEGEAEAPPEPEAEGPPEAEAEAPAPPPKPAARPAARPKVSFTPEQQGYVNSLLAEERRKAKATVDRMITQLETEKNKATTTAAEKEALEQRIEE